MGKETTCNVETQETQVQSLCSGDPQEEGTATHSSIPAWRMPWEKPDRLQGYKESDMTEMTEQHSEETNTGSVLLMFENSV